MRRVFLTCFGISPTVKASRALGSQLSSHVLHGPGVADGAWPGQIGLCSGLLTAGRGTTLSNHVRTPGLSVAGPFVPVFASERQAACSSVQLLARIRRGTIISISGLRGHVGGLRAGAREAHLDQCEWQVMTLAFHQAGGAHWDRGSSGS